MNITQIFIYTYKTLFKKKGHFWLFWAKQTIGELTHSFPISEPTYPGLSKPLKNGHFWLFWTEKNFPKTSE